MNEKIHAFLDFGIPGTIYPLECFYGQLAGVNALVAALANVAAVLGDVLYAEQVAEGFTVKDDIQHRAVRQAVLKNPAHQVLLVTLL